MKRYKKQERDMLTFNSADVVFNSESGRLSRLMNLEETTPEQWEPEDMAEMARHQLSAPLEFDLSTVPASGTRPKLRGEILKKAGKGRIETFEDLLFSPDPPLELLALSKKFFKDRVRACGRATPEG